jgi:hypothetical protein
LCKKAEFAFCVGTGEHADAIHEAMGKCAMQTMDNFGEMAEEYHENMDPNAPCPLKDYMKHVRLIDSFLLLDM